MLHIQKQPFELSPVLTRALPKAKLVGPALAAQSYQFFDGALVRTSYDTETNNLNSIVDYSGNDRTMTPVDGLVPLVAPDSRPPRGQVQSVLDFEGDGIINMGSDFPVNGNWTKVIAFRPDLTAMTGTNCMLWRSTGGNSNIHRVTVFNGSVYHYVGTTGNNVQVDASLNGEWTYIIASWNNTSKQMRLSIRDEAPISDVGTDQIIGNSNHFVGGDDSTPTFIGEICGMALFDSDVFDDSALLADIHEFFTAAIGQR